MGSTEDPGDTGQVVERYRFDGIVVDAVAHTLCRDGQFHSVEPKAFAVLLLLLRHADELLVRDLLLDAVWGHRHVTPGVLTRAIAQLRSALDDHSHEPRYIQTQHGLGYRFIGKLLPPEQAEAPVSLPPESEPVASPASALPHAEAGDEEIPVPTLKPASRFWRGRQAANVPLPLWLRSRTWLIGLGLALLALGGGAWWWAHAPAIRPAVETPSIAVMPFSSLSGNADDRYFADGLAVEMHDALANVPGLKVAARQVAAVSDADSDVRRIGRRLGVATLLDASVRREGGRVRISARLSDATTGFTLWSETYDREITDVFALQGEIASKVVQALLGHLPGDGAMVARRLTPTTDVNAYDAYLRGLALLQRPIGETGNDRAMASFRQALEIDPQFTRAQAGICRAQIARLEGVSDAEAFERARQACAQAQAMDPELREVSLALAEIARVSGQNEQALTLYQQVLDEPALRADGLVGLARSYGALGQEERAQDYFQQAIAARPSDAQIYRLLGYHQWLRGDLPKAIEAFVTATILQPEDSRLWSSLGGLYLAQGDSAQAGRAFSMSLSIEPNAGALTNLGTMKFDDGEYAVAAGLFRQATVLEPGDYLHWGNLGDALSASAETAAQAQAPYRRAAQLAQQYVDVRRDDAYALALLSWYRANLGERQRARQDLQAAQKLGTQQAEVALWCAQTLTLIEDQAGARRCIADAVQQGIPQQRIDALLALQRHAVAAGAARQK
ncbi:winged helix-turn-helix domain-containing protein [Stenotrophomonas sp. SY1]|uniref:winged helix-turn-helix domain-containing protein n=1 Tax=Stenotrophomonas sp. SY1 TaxID=477235 RepID=UPI001E4BC700|nr:winged helix-turn-helix domain-containing protein [Stenotrophomonas sp. SY1]MCD9086385.1 winged helix-turn-helix domain-containing protein [Stenotrophomonas sp. SY1]